MAAIRKRVCFFCFILIVQLSSASDESDQIQVRDTSIIVTNPSWISKIKEMGINYTTIMMYEPQGITNQTIVFYGLHGEMAKFTKDFTRDKAVFEICTTEPHTYFKNNLYMYIKVFDDNGAIKYEKRVNGVGENITSHVFSLKSNDTLEIFHKEMWRVKSSDVDVIKSRLLNTYRVTQYGLQNLAVGQDPQLIFALKIYTCGEIIMSDEIIRETSIEFSPEKQAFISLVLMLEEQYHETFIPIVKYFYNCSYIKLLDKLYSHQPKSENYFFFLAEENYIFARKDSTIAPYSLKKYTPQGMTSQTIVFNGLSDQVIAQFTKYFTEDNAIFEVLSTDPHQYYKNDMYMYLRVMDQDGEVKYEKRIYGVGENITSDVFSLQLNDIVEIFHKEIRRVKSDDVDISRQRRHNTYRVTKYGLQNLAVNKDPQLIFALKVYEYGQLIMSDHPDVVSIELSPKRQAFINLVLLLEEQYQKSLIPMVENFCNCSYINLMDYLDSQKSKIVKESNNIAGNDVNIPLYSLRKYIPHGITSETIVFNGLDGNIANLTKDFTKDIGVFEVYTTEPHVYFKNDLYMYIKIMDPDGTIKYKKKLNGTGVSETSHIFSLQPNDTVEIFHKEMSRVQSDAAEINRETNLNTYKVTEYGLQNLAFKSDLQLKFLPKLQKFGQFVATNETLNRLPFELSADKQGFIHLVMLLGEQHRKSFVPLVESFCKCTYTELLRNYYNSDLVIRKYFE